MAVITNGWQHSTPASPGKHNEGWEDEEEHHAEALKDHDEIPAPVANMVSIADASFEKSNVCRVGRSQTMAISREGEENTKSTSSQTAQTVTAARPCLDRPHQSISAHVSTLFAPTTTHLTRQSSAPANLRP